jgi:hypothetical protein
MKKNLMTTLAFSAVLLSFTTMGDERLRNFPTRGLRNVTPLPVRTLRPMALKSVDDQSKPDSAKKGHSLPIFKYIPNSRQGRLLKGHFKAMVSYNKNAEALYQRSMKVMRAKAPQLSGVLFNSYKKIPTKKYFERFLVAETLRELKSPSAFSALKAIATKPMPKEKFPVNVLTHKFTSDKEAHIRVTAIDGLAALAKKDHRDSLKTLKTLLKTKDITLKRRVVRGILASGNFQAKKKFLLRNLAKRDHHLISLKVTKVRSVPHPDMPENFVIPNGRNQTRAPRAN